MNEQRMADLERRLEVVEAALAERARRILLLEEYVAAVEMQSDLAALTAARLRAAIAVSRELDEVENDASVARVDVGIGGDRGRNVVDLDAARGDQELTAP